MAKLMITRGLPASGKSTFAKEYVQHEVQKGNLDVMNVDRDSIRLLNGFPLIAGNYEHQVSKIRDGMIRTGLKQGFTVIESSTNLKASYVKDLAKIADFYGAGVEIVDVDTALDECIRRDKYRGLLEGGISVGEKVIRDMHRRYFKNSAFPENPIEIKQPMHFEPYVANEDLEKVIICDIDGTIADMNGRNPYDYSQVSHDLVHWDVIELLYMYVDKGYKIIFLSGRDGSCYEDTFNWLCKAFGFCLTIEGKATPIGWDLYMRAAGDGRQDAIIKYELFNEHIRDRYHVLGVFDDRDQVVDLWRNKLGIRTYQVADGNF